MTTGNVAVWPATSLLVVVKGERPTLLGRNWLNKMTKLEPDPLHLKSGVAWPLGKYGEEVLGTFWDYEARIEVDPDAVPWFCKAWTLPYSMRQHRCQPSCFRRDNPEFDFYVPPSCITNLFIPLFEFRCKWCATIRITITVCNN